MTDAARPADSLMRNGLELAVAALAGTATMARQALNDLRTMGFGDLVDQQLAMYEDPRRDAAIDVALSAAVEALTERNGGTL